MTGRKKTVAFMTAVMLLCGMIIGVLAETTTQQAPDYLMEGYDGDSANHDWETNLFFQRMQEKTGISFQFRQYTDFSRWTERKASLLSGEDLPDVLFKAALNANEVRDLYAAGYLIDLKPYLAEYAPDLWALLQQREDWQSAISMEDGAIPALPAMSELQNNNVIWVNKDWLDRLKLEIPTTAEELTEVLRAFKEKDPNRSGGADEVPLTFIGMWELRFLGHAFGIIDNDDYVTARNGQVTSSLTTDENRRFLTWLHQLWDEKLLDQSGFNNTDSLRQITDDKKAIPYGVMLAPTPLSVVPSSALGQYTAMMPLIYKGQQVYRSLLGDLIRGTFAITKDCKEPEKLVAWVNYLYTEEGSRLAMCGVEGDEYLWNEDGYWEWSMDVSTVANDILPGHTISEGGTAPGMVQADFQLKYADEMTRSNLEMLYEVQKYSVQPYPFVTFTKEDEKRINAIREELMPWAEAEMACFVAGDTEISDDSWQAFCDGAEQRGLSELVSLLQKYVK